MLAYKPVCRDVFNNLSTASINFLLLLANALILVASSSVNTLGNNEYMAPGAAVNVLSPKVFPSKKPCTANF